MKVIATLIAFLIVVISAVTAQAQFDEKFYFPSKKWSDIPADLSFEEVNLKADTCVLHALFFKPETTPRATVLFFHGAGGNISTYTFMTKPLVDAGFQVLMVDFRGYGKSTGKPTHLNIASDGQMLFDNLIKREDVKGKKLILFGASIGSQVAAKLAKDNAGKVDALVLEGPMSSFTDIAAAYAPEAQREMIRQYLVSPYSAREDVKRVNIPTLVVHSKEDKEVPFAQGEQVFNNAAGKKDLWVYTGGHLEAMKIAPDEYIKRIESLIGL